VEVILEDIQSDQTLFSKERTSVFSPHALRFKIKDDGFGLGEALQKELKGDGDGDFGIQNRGKESDKVPRIQPITLDRKQRKQYQSPSQLFLKNFKDVVRRLSNWISGRREPKCT
jgi:hypothetical protein